jgi:GT2 family glycosyltransferase
MSPPKVYIVILNWNSWRDTIECLKSIQRSDYPNYYIVVVDNGSHDGSCERIEEWARGDIFIKSLYIDSCDDTETIRVVSYDRNIAENGGIKDSEQELSSLPAAKRVVLIKSVENLGFACGSNLGIRYVLAVGGVYVLLLNNDTVIDGMALSSMVNFMESHSGYSGATGQIRLYNNPSRIWNCGGALTFYGTRRYYHRNSQVNKVPKCGFKNISFISGCAALFRASLFNKVGLLSELFFFGEEDFELSLRLKRIGCKLACIYDAIIYHKVGSSIKIATNTNNIGYIYIYYLSRFIDMRYYWNRLPWKIWRYSCFFYIFPLLKIKYRTSCYDLWSLRKKLLNDSISLDRVSKATFEKALNSGLKA